LLAGYVSGALTLSLRPDLDRIQGLSLASVISSSATSS
jgi:hypothetical protein